MDDMTQEPTEGKRGISRRTVLATGTALATAAWAAPIVRVAQASPIITATQFFVNFSGQACKWSGGSTSLDKSYVYQLSSENHFDYSILISVLSIDMYTTLNDPAHGGSVYPRDPSLGPAVDFIYPQNDNKTCTSGLFLSGEGSSLCSNTALTQTDGSGAAAFTVAPHTTVPWTATAGRYPFSANSGMFIVFTVYSLEAGPNNCAEIGTYAIGSGTNSTSVCRTPSSGLWPSYCYYQ